MKRGEITGQFFENPQHNVGMPFRSTFVPKKNERKNFSQLEEDVEIKEGTTTTTDFKLNYYDPTQNNYCNNQLLALQNNTITNEYIERNIQNISTYSAEHINDLSLDIFGEIMKKNVANFCFMPIGVLKLMIANDSSINKLAKLLNSKESFHEIRTSESNYLSRASIILDLPHQHNNYPTKYHEDIDTYWIEFPTRDTQFAFGVICGKEEKEIHLTSKTFSSSILNLNKTTTNIFLPAFKQTNKIRLNSFIGKYIETNNDIFNEINYIQTNYFELQNNIYIKTSTLRPMIDASREFIYYLRYIPNNVILMLGRKH